jgi:uncharacterized protein
VNVKSLNLNPKTYALVLAAGDEVVEEVQAFARTRFVSAGQLTGIGAFQEVTVGFFSFEKRDYEKIDIHEQVEVLSLLGDITLKEGVPQLHMHVVLGKSDGTAHGGHLLKGLVRPTLEIILVESPRHLRRRLDPESGLALIDLEA